MAIERHLLKGILKQYIEAIFHLTDFIPDHSIECVVPTGNVFIIFELDGFQRNTYDNETLNPIASFKEVWISGMQKNHISMAFIAALNLELFIGADSDLSFGLIAGFMAGFGWVAAMLGILYLFENRSFKAFIINEGYCIVALSLMGGILGAW